MISSGVVYFLIAWSIFLLLAALRSIKIKPTELSEYELERRVAAGDEEAIYQAQRQQLLPEVVTLRHVIDVLLGIIMVSLFLHSGGWLFGIICALIALLEISMLARQHFVSRTMQPLYENYEDYTLLVADKLRPVLRFVREVSDARPVDFKVHSRDEMAHIIDEAKDILTHEERLLLTHAMQFEQKKVSEVMTPRSVVRSIDKSEVIGPVTLDTVYSSGHSRFPVVDKDIDHVVGLLYTHELITQAKGSAKVTAEKIMDKKVYYINESQTLDSALAGFLRVKHHLFIVVNEFEETTGIVTIEDVIEALIGRKIVDEFDQHEDLRVVAKRLSKKRHTSANETHIS
jgi:CBS domain containing-hemolysin-like protein